MHYRHFVNPLQLFSLFASCGLLAYVQQSLTKRKVASQCVVSDLSLDFYTRSSQLNRWGKNQGIELRILGFPALFESDVNANLP